MYNHAKIWGVRPSNLVDITDPYTAYCFDDVVATWGLFVTNELERIEGKNEKEINRKRRNRLLQLVDAPDSVRFRKIRKPAKEGR